MAEDLHNKQKNLAYTLSGVDTIKEEAALKGLILWIKKTWRECTDIGVPQLPFGYFANVINVSENLGIALSTDGVGTKILVAQMMDKYDTIGIDCVAMNVNDVICVGAKPLTMLDYIAVQDVDPHILEEIAKGLYTGAMISKITIPAGEIAQIREMITGAKPDRGFDLVGTCVGIVPLDKIIIGQDIQEGDSLIGLRSSGIHSNGLTLAREVLFKKMGFRVDKHFNELNRTLGEELLEPTHIYVPEVMEILNSDINMKALIHITGDGFLNLKRVASDVGYMIDFLPEPQPIFSLIQNFGRIPDEEMFRVYNMGIGFCLIVPENEVDKTLDIARKYVQAYRIGYAIRDETRKLIIKPKGLVGKGSRFFKESF